MRSFLALIVTVSALGWSNLAFAGNEKVCFTTCATSIGVNSGHTSKRCDDDNFNCNCVEAAIQAGTGTYTMTTGTCSSPKWSWAGLTINGYNCCVANFRDASPEQSIEATSPEAKKVSEVFSPEQRIYAYFGYVDNVSRSPSAGRSQQGLAMLDACVGYTNANTYTATDWNSYQACYSDCDSTKNGYCNNSGTNNGSSQTNYRCKDRCDCAIDTNHAWSTCEAL